MLRSCFLSNFFESRSAVSKKKSKMSQPIIGHGGHLFLRIGPNNTDVVRTLRSCCLSSFVEFRSAVSEKKSKMFQPIRGQGGHLIFPIGPKNTNLVEDIDILFPTKFCRIPFSGFREEVENVSVNQRPGRPSCFSDRPEKHKLGRGRLEFASCQVTLNSVLRFQRRNRKCLSQSEARAAILFLPSAPITQTW